MINPKQKRHYVSFYELSDVWQQVARDNLGEYAETTTYIEPLDSDDPAQHALFDLSDCYIADPDSEFTGIIPVSNNCAIGFTVIDSYENTCTLTPIS